MTMTKTFDVGVRSPVSRQAQVLLGRADALLSESIGERDAGTASSEATSPHSRVLPQSWHRCPIRSARGHVHATPGF